MARAERSDIREEQTLCLDSRGVLVKDTHGSTLRFAPPLVITADEIHWAADRFAAVRRACQGPRVIRRDRNKATKTRKHETLNERSFFVRSRFRGKPRR